MLDKERENILKVSPDYEDYTENEAKLTIDEIKELGMAQLAKKSCCGSSGGCSSGGCSSGGCSSGGGSCCSSR